MSRVTPETGRTRSASRPVVALAGALVVGLAIAAFPAAAFADELVVEPTTPTISLDADPRAAEIQTAQLQQAITTTAAPTAKKIAPNFQSRTMEAIRATRSASMFRWGTPAYAKWYAKAHIKAKFNWRQKQFACLSRLWSKESSWRYLAKNPRGRVYGIPQTSVSTIKSLGMNLTTYMRSPELQVQAGARYINYRYGSPCKALDHAQRRGWY